SREKWLPAQSPPVVIQSSPAPTIEVSTSGASLPEEPAASASSAALAIERRKPSPLRRRVGWGYSALASTRGFAVLPHPRPLPVGEGRRFRQIASALIAAKGADAALAPSAACAACGRSRARRHARRHP